MDDVSEASLAGVLSVIHELIDTRAVLRGGKALSGRVDTRSTVSGAFRLGSNPCAVGGFVASDHTHSIDDAKIIRGLLADQEWSAADIQLDIGAGEYDEDWTVTITRTRLVFAWYYRMGGHDVTDEDEPGVLKSLADADIVDVAGPIYPQGPMGPARNFGRSAAMYLHEKTSRLEFVRRGMRPGSGQYQCKSSVVLRDRLQKIFASNPVLASTRELRSRGAMKHFVRDCDEWILGRLGEARFAKLIDQFVGVSLDKWLLAGRRSVMVPE